VSFATVNYLGDGASGQSASHDGEDLNMSWPSNRVDPPTLLLLHVSGGVGLLASHCSSPGGGGLPGGCNRRNLRSCEAEPHVVVAGTFA
jgi:hypothetical protein